MVRFLIDQVSRKISERRSGEPLGSQFLFQQIGVLIQRFNSILFRMTLAGDDGIDTLRFGHVFSVFLSF